MIVKANDTFCGSKRHLTTGFRRDLFQLLQAMLASKSLDKRLFYMHATMLYIMVNLYTFRKLRTWNRCTSLRNCSIDLTAIFQSLSYALKKMLGKQQRPFMEKIVQIPFTKYRLAWKKTRMTVPRYFYRYRNIFDLLLWFFIITTFLIEKYVFEI